MRLRRVLIAMLAGLAVFAVAQYEVQRFATMQLRGFERAVGGWADIQTGRCRVWLWGVADCDDVRIGPQDWVNALYGLPLRMELRVNRVHLHRLRLGWKDGIVLRSFDIDISEAVLPVPDWGWSVVVARDAHGRRLRAPTLADLGINTVRFDARARIRLDADLRQPRLQVLATAPSLAVVALDCALDLEGAEIQDPGSIAVRHCRANVTDRGLVRRLETRMAKDNRMPLSMLRAAIAEQIATAAVRAHLSMLDARALQRFIFDPRRTLQVTMRPSSPLRLGDIPRSVWPGLVPLLGLGAALPAPPSSTW